MGVEGWMGNGVLGAAGVNVTASGLFRPQCCLYVGKINKKRTRRGGGQTRRMQTITIEQWALQEYQHNGRDVYERPTISS